MKLFSSKTFLALLFASVGLQVSALYLHRQGDLIVHGDLYRYGLQFNTEWASEYWSYSWIVIGFLLGSMILMGGTLLNYYTVPLEESWASRLSLILLPLFAAGFMLVSLYFIFRIDSIVHSTLYNYGLQFSLGWAEGYWRITRTILALDGVSVVLAVPLAYAAWAKTKSE